jgi:hypothetical protein
MYDIVSQAGDPCRLRLQAQSSYRSMLSIGVRTSRCYCARPRQGGLCRAVPARRRVTEWWAAIGRRERSHERGGEARLGERARERLVTLWPSTPRYVTRAWSNLTKDRGSDTISEEAGDLADVEAKAIEG